MGECGLYVPVWLLGMGGHGCTPSGRWLQLWVPVTYLAVWELTRILLPSCMMPGIGHATLDLTDLVLGEIDR